jgi:hypothetical protein
VERRLAAATAEDVGAPVAGTLRGGSLRHFGGRPTGGNIAHTVVDTGYSGVTVGTQHHGWISQLA